MSKFILNIPREMHLGFIKETFGRGAVLELDEERGLLIVDGRKFEDTRDLEILQRQALKNPDKPWLVPYSKEMLDVIKGNVAPVQQPTAKPRPGTDMPIIQDDTSDHESIDIRHTQMSKIHAAEKQASRTAAHDREVGRKMEVIQGDETASERLARLKGKGDMNSLAERVAIKRGRATMPVIHDDSLGMGVGRSEIAMNAGQRLPSREDAEANTETKQAEAELRKQHAVMARKRAGISEPDGTIDQDIPPELADAVEVVGGTDTASIIGSTGQAVSGVTLSAEDEAALDADFDAEAAKQEDEGPCPEAPVAESKMAAENAELKAENADLKTGMNAILERLAALEKAPAKPAKKAVKTKTAKTAKKVTRTPVTTE